MGLKISRKSNGKEEIFFALENATYAQAGLMSAEDKAKLDKDIQVQLSPAGTRNTEIAAGTDYGVPAYIVGAGTLQVFLDGVLCAGGNDTETCAYKEVGTPGQESAVIRFHQAISTDYEILVRVQ